MSAVREVVVYIHGVADYQEGASHDEDYEALAEGIRQVRGSHWPEDACRIEWGWSQEPLTDRQGHELLTKAQERFGLSVLNRVKGQKDLTLHPLRLAMGNLRKLLMLGMSDMFYYTSSDGRNSVRRAVARQIAVSPCFRNIESSDERISLTLIGHSAGSVIAFDLLFYLFWSEGDRVRIAEDQKKEHEFVETEKFLKTSNADQDLEKLRFLRLLAQTGRLRLRRFYSLGSPISLLAVRSNAVLRILATGGRLNPAFNGLIQDFPEQELRLTGPRWINIWDKDDPICWPVEDLMDAGKDIVLDQYIDISDDIFQAHNKYWRHPRVHEIIAKSWANASR